MFAIICHLLFMVRSVQTIEDIFISKESLTWSSAYLYCKNMDMVIFNKSADVQSIRRCRELDYEFWINHPINIYSWKYDDAGLSPDDEDLDECLMIDCQGLIIKRHCLESFPCVCQNRKWFNRSMNYASCRLYCQKAVSMVMEVQTARGFCTSNSQNITTFWGNVDLEVSSLNKSLIDETITEGHLCVVSTRQGAKKLHRCAETFPFICIREGFHPCGLQTYPTGVPSSTTSSSIKTSSTLRFTSIKSTSSGTTFPSTKSSRQTFSSTASVSITDTSFKTSITSTDLSVTSSSSTGLDGYGMKDGDGETGSSTLLVAVLVTSVAVVGVLLGVIIFLFRRMRRLTKSETTSHNKEHDVAERKPPHLYEDNTARQSQHEYQEIDKVQPFRYYKEVHDDSSNENTYTEILPDTDMNYVILENGFTDKQLIVSEESNAKIDPNKMDNDQKESNVQVNLSFETDSTYFVLKKT